MPRSLKKGPFVDAHLLKKAETAQAENDKRDQNVVTSLHDRAINDWSHF